eukprot:tig00000405_g479.t1
MPPNAEGMSSGTSVARKHGGVVASSSLTSRQNGGPDAPHKPVPARARVTTLTAAKPTRATGQPRSAPSITGSSSSRAHCKLAAGPYATALADEAPAAAVEPAAPLPSASSAPGRTDAPNRATTASSSAAPAVHRSVSSGSLARPDGSGSNAPRRSGSIGELLRPGTAVIELPRARAGAADHVRRSACLRRLSVADCGLSGRRLAEVAGAAAVCPSLAELVLSGNGVGSCGAAPAVAEALGASRSLRALRLRGAGLVSDDVAAVAEGACRGASLEALHLEENEYVRELAAEALAERLPRLARLRSLFLDGCRPAPLLIGRVRLAVRASPALLSLGLSGNAVGDAGAAALADLLSSGPCSLTPSSRSSWTWAATGSGRPGRGPWRRRWARWRGAGAGARPWASSAWTGTPSGRPASSPSPRPSPGRRGGEGRGRGPPPRHPLALLSLRDVGAGAGDAAAAALARAAAARAPRLRIICLDDNAAVSSASLAAVEAALGRAAPAEGGPSSAAPPEGAAEGTARPADAKGPASRPSSQPEITGGAGRGRPASGRPQRAASQPKLQAVARDKPAAASAPRRPKSAGRPSPRPRRRAASPSDRAASLRRLGAGLRARARRSAGPVPLRTTAKPAAKPAAAPGRPGPPAPRPAGAGGRPSSSSARPAPPSSSAKRGGGSL